METNLKSPKVTVLMPVYNGESYLREAIESILNQSFRDFEFLIIDDGSTDRSFEIAKSYADSRIRLEKNGTNQGLIYTLNRGLSEARGTYIARMDADDISLPGRLAAQVAFMDAHPDIAVCGTWIKILGETARPYPYPTQPEDIRAFLLFSTALMHPSVMLRASVFKDGRFKYESRDAHGEDYGLWVSLVSAGYKLANIPRVLLLYRKHLNNVSALHSPAQIDVTLRIRMEQLQRLGLSPSAEEFASHNSIRGEGSDFLPRAEAWLLKIRAANERENIYDEAALDRMLYRRWKTVCGANAARGLKVWKLFIHSPLYYNSAEISPLDSAKLFIKCLI